MPKLLLQAVAGGYRIVMRAGKIAWDLCKSACCGSSCPTYTRWDSCPSTSGVLICRNQTNTLYLCVDDVCEDGSTINGKVVKIGGLCYSQRIDVGVVFVSGTPGPGQAALPTGARLGPSRIYECIGAAGENPCPEGPCPPPGFWEAKACRDSYYDTYPRLFVCRETAEGCKGFALVEGSIPSGRRACFLIDPSRLYTYAEVISVGGEIAETPLIPLPAVGDSCCSCESILFAGGDDGACERVPAIDKPYGNPDTQRSVVCCCVKCLGDTRGPSKVSAAITYEAKTFLGEGSERYLAIWRRIDPATLSMTDEDVPCGADAMLGGTLLETFYNPDGTVALENSAPAAYTMNVCPPSVPITGQGPIWVPTPVTGIGYVLADGVSFSEEWTCRSHAVNYRFDAPDGSGSFQTWIANMRVEYPDAPECQKGCDDIPPIAPVTSSGAVAFLNARL